MLKGLLVSAALVAGCTFAVSVQAETLQTGRSTSMHHRHHHMMMGHRNNMSYGVGSRDPRTTATGGNAGGYSTRN